MARKKKINKINGNVRGRKQKREEQMIRGDEEA